MHILSVRQTISELFDQLNEYNVLLRLFKSHMHKLQTNNKKYVLLFTNLLH